MVFCSTVHLASFLLPVAAYNNRISRLQVRGRQHWVGLSAKWYFNISRSSPVLFELVLRAPQWPFAAACQLFRLDSATRQEFPVVHTREGIVLRFVDFAQFCILQAQARHCALQVNALFDTNQDAVLRFSRGLTMDLSCMFFQAGGVFVVTIRVVSAIVSTIVILMTWLK